MALVPHNFTYTYQKGNLIFWQILQDMVVVYVCIISTHSRLPQLLNAIHAHCHTNI